MVGSRRRVALLDALTELLRAIDVTSRHRSIGGIVVDAKRDAEAFIVCQGAQSEVIHIAIRPGTPHGPCAIAFDLADKAIVASISVSQCPVDIADVLATFESSVSGEAGSAKLEGIIEGPHGADIRNRRRQLETGGKVRDRIDIGTRRVCIGAKTPSVPFPAHDEYLVLLSTE